MDNKAKTVTQVLNVYAFKNGFCLIAREFDIPPNKDGTPFELVDLPSNPAYGTFSIQTTSNVTISSIRTKKTHQFIESQCTTVEELISANMDQENVELLTQGLETSPTWMEGKIQKNLQNQDNPKLTSSQTQCGQMVILEKVNNEIIALPIKSIISIRGKNLKTKFQKQIVKNCLSINYKNESNTNGKGLMKYLTFGITWVPSYELDLKTPTESNVKMLQLSLKSIILNDIEDIEVANLSCIVGHPNLSKYVDITDPMFSTNTAKQFLDHLIRSESPSSSYTVSRQQYNSNRFNLQPNSSKYVMVSAEDEDGYTKEDINDDFYLYNFQQVLLEQNEKVSLPIFDMQVPYKDVYHCKIDPKQQSTEQKNSKSDYKDHIITAEVWHGVEFDNKSGHTLTTAPVLITRDNHQFICQENLTFTLNNSPVFIHLTKAPGIRVTHDEKVPDARQSTNTTSVKIFDQDYVKEQWDGMITVTNGMQESVTVVLKIQLHGSISNYSTQPNVDAIQQGDFLVNQLHDIRWDVQLGPRQTQEIKYSRAFNRSVKPIKPQRSTYEDDD